MLDSDQRPTGGAQRGVVGIAVDLVERHPSIAVGIGRAEQPGNERVGEEAALDLVGLLAVLGRRTGGEEHRAFASHALAELDIEGRNG